MKKYTFILFLSLAIFPSLVFSMSQGERIQDAQSIINLFSQQYGPLPWKSEYRGVDFETLSQKFISDAGAATSDKEFYNIAALFLGSFGDAHVSYSLPSSLEVFVRVDFDYFEDGVIVTGVGRNEDGSEIPVKIGDKLIAVDGVPVSDYLHNLISYDDNGYDLANLEIAAWNLTYRPQFKFPNVPEGEITFTLVSKDTGNQYDARLKWVRRGFDIAEMPPKGATFYMAKAMTSPDASLNKPYEEGTIIDKVAKSFYVSIPIGERAEGSVIGMIKPFFPVWDSFEERMKNPFYSGIYKIGDKKIGFIRIRTWSTSSSKRDVEAFENEIKYFNQNTDALVIDQTNNGGGNICYGYDVASFFITEPKQEMKFQVRANRTRLSWMEYSYQYDFGDKKALAKEWLDALRSAVTSGQYLSDPIPICSADGMVYPHRDKNQNMLVYVKPVLLLVNELDFSTADMFPALLQDWKAVTIFGTRTAGAGGNVIEAWPVGNSEMTIRLTQSLVYRNNEVISDEGVATHYIENVGVIPEIPYQIRSTDYFDQYQSYRNAIDKAVTSLVQ